VAYFADLRITSQVNLR